MNIIDAIKTAKNNQKIKRKSWVKYESPVFHLLKRDDRVWILKVDYWSENNGIIYDGLNVDDYLAEDWEVLE
jgi:hypothetical protein